jgi:hypothetical protein
MTVIWGQRCSGEGSGRVDLHDHGLGLGEELAAEVATFAADAQCTDASEGRAQLSDEEAVHPDRAHVEPGRDPVGTVKVLGDNWASRP